MFTITIISILFIAALCLGKYYLYRLAPREADDQIIDRLHDRFDVTPFLPDKEEETKAQLFPKESNEIHTGDTSIHASGNTALNFAEASLQKTFL